jgi:hypothetical protein
MPATRLTVLTLAAALTAFGQGDPAHQSGSSKPLISIKMKWPGRSTEKGEKDGSGKPSTSPAPAVGNGFTVGANYFVALAPAEDSKNVGSSKTVGGDPAPEPAKK